MSSTGYMLTWDREICARVYVDYARMYSLSAWITRMPVSVTVWVYMFTCVCVSVCACLRLRLHACVCLFTCVGLFSYACVCDCVGVCAIIRNWKWLTTVCPKCKCVFRKKCACMRGCVHVCWQDAPPRYIFSHCISAYSIKWLLYCNYRKLKMVNNFGAAPKCKSGYISNDNKRITRFHFPLKKNPDLNQLWTRFVNRTYWKHSVICELHFEEKFIHRLQKSTLKWKMSPVPSMYPCELLQSPSSLSTLQTSRKQKGLSGRWIWYISRKWNHQYSARS